MADEDERSLRERRTEMDAPEAEDPTSEKLRRTLRAFESQLDQQEHLYAMYFAGVERAAPIQRRQQLELLATQINNTPKPTAGLRFQVSVVMSRYESYREKWDKQMKALER